MRRRIQVRLKAATRGMMEKMANVGLYGMAWYDTVLMEGWCVVTEEEEEEEEEGQCKPRYLQREVDLTVGP